MFRTRLLSGIVLVILALLTLSIGGAPLLLVLALISMIAYRELTKALLCATAEKKLNTLETVGMIGVALYYVSVYFAEQWNLQLMCIYVFTFPKFQASQVVAAFFAFVYAPVMLSFVYLTRESALGIYMVWLIVLSAWGSDTCAYCVGMLIGKKKIFPVLSPKKSLEGCIGGVLGAALLGGLYGYFFVEQQLPDQSVTGIIAFICAIGAVMSMVGDLAASAIKRNNNIKDYGKLIPGHGGIMDRFDSMIVTAPMIYFLTVLMIRL